MDEARPGARAAAPVRSDQITLSLAGSAVTVTSSVAGLVPWLRELLEPGFAPAAAAAAIAEVHADAAVAPRPEPSELIPCFAFESELIHLPGCRAGDRATVESDRLGVRITVAPGRAEVVATRSDARLRPAAVRVVREAALAHALASGTQLQLHASCVELDGRCLAFAGPKRAGKTTMAVHLAGVLGPRLGLVANDRVLLSTGDGACRVIGVPTIASVRLDTLRRFPRLLARIPNVERPIDLTLEETELALDAAGPVPAPRQLYLSTAQFAAAIGARLSPGGRLTALVVTTVDEYVEEFELRPMSRAEADAELRRHSFGLSPVPTVFDTAFGAMAPAPDAGARPDLDGVELARLSVGPGFLESPAAAQRLVRALLHEA